MWHENQASYYTADVGDFTPSDTDYTSSGGEYTDFQCRQADGSNRSCYIHFGGTERSRLFLQALTIKANRETATAQSARF